MERNKKTQACKSTRNEPRNKKITTNGLLFNKSLTTSCCKGLHTVDSRKKLVLFVLPQYRRKDEYGESSRKTR